MLVRHAAGRVRAGEGECGLPTPSVSSCEPQRLAMTVVPASLDIQPTEGSIVHIATLSGLRACLVASTASSKNSAPVSERRLPLEAGLQGGEDDQPSCLGSIDVVLLEERIG